MMFLHPTGKPWRSAVLRRILLGVMMIYMGTVFFVWTNLERYRPLSQNDVTPPAEKKRLNLIIVAHGRSGSTLLGEMFNHHPRVFYLFEPLQALKRVYTRSTPKEYHNLALRYLNNIFRCNFSESSSLYFNDLDDFYRRQDHPLLSFAMVSPPLCLYNITDPRWDPKKCDMLERRHLENVCRNYYSVTVIKVLLWRVPDAYIENLWSACKFKEYDRAECKIIFLVRDPRPVMSSSKLIRFIGKSSSELDRQSAKSCHQTEKKLNMLRMIPPWLKGCYKLIRYEDMAVNPLGILREVFDFAGLPVLISVKKWIQNATQPTKEMRMADEKKTIAVVRTVKNSLIVLNKWREVLAPFEVRMIEERCRSVMGLMGYFMTDGSADKLSALKVPRLFNESYTTKEWCNDV